MDLSSLGIAVLSAVVYSLSMYVKKHLNPDNPQSFDVTKFLTTLIWGAVIGVVLQLSGVPITEQTVEEQFIAYAGLIAITENIVKAILRALSR
jgi:hypothetical protein